MRDDPPCARNVPSTNACGPRPPSSWRRGRSDVMTRPSNPGLRSTSVPESVSGQFEQPQLGGPSARPIRPGQPSGPVGLETRDPAGRVQLQLQLQRRAPKNRRIHFQRAGARFATLAIADLVTFGVVHALVVGVIWLALVAERFSLNLTLERFKQWRSPAARTLVVGCDEDYDALRRGAALAESREVAVIGFVDVARPPAAQAIGHVEELARLLEEHHIDTVLVCGYVTDQAFGDIANTATATGCRLLSVPRSFDLGGLQPRMLSWHGPALVELTAPTLKVGHIILERCLDLLGTGLGLAVV